MKSLRILMNENPLVLAYALLKKISARLTMVAFRLCLCISSESMRLSSKIWLNGRRWLRPF
jgi:hypothetical protein